MRQLKRASARLLRFVKNWPVWRIRRPIWGTMVLPFWLAMTIVCALGPHLQAHTLPLVSTVSPTIYEAIYPGSLARFPSLSDWIFFSFLPPYLLIAAAVTLAAFSFRSARAFSVAAGVALFVSFSLADTALMVLGEPNQSISSNIVSNAIGGVIVSAIAYVMLATIKYVFGWASGHRFLSSLAGAVAIIGLAVGLSSALHYAIKSIYRPLRADVELVASLPLEGDIASTDRDDALVSAGNSDQRATDPRSVDLVPSNGRTRRVEVSSPDHAGGVTWERAATAPDYTLSVSVRRGCFRGDEAEFTNQSVLQFDNVRAFSTARTADVLTFASPKAVSVSAPIVGISYFWLTDLSEDDSFSVKHFVQPSEKIHLSPDGAFDIYATKILFDFESDRSALAEKTLAFSVNGERVTFNFRPRADLDPAARVSCRGVPENAVSVASTASEYTVETADVTATLVFEFTPDLGGESIAISDDELTISGTHGWTSVHDVKMNPSTYLGRVGFLSIRENTSSLSVYGRRVETEVEDSVQLIGQFEMYYAGKDRIRVAGVADAAWRNNFRLNRTRWELIGEGLKLFLIAVFAGSIGVAGRFATKVLEDGTEDPTNWSPL